MIAAARLTQVSKRYGRRWALVRVSLEIPHRASVLLTGANGAGKTTLLRVLATSLAPTRGRVEIFGKRAGLHNEAIRPRVGLVTHRSHLYEDLSAEENLTLLTRFRRDIDARRVPEVLERVGLSARKHSPVRTFSAGMQRRLCLARALLKRPDLLLLDEPFGQLDPQGVTLVEELIGELQGEVTLVMSTHDIERGRALCDWHVHMDAARVLAGPEPIPAVREGSA